MIDDDNNNDLTGLMDNQSLILFFKKYRIS